MHITDGGYVKDELGGTLGFVMKGLSKFYPEHGLFFSPQDLEEIARLMRGDDDDLERIVRQMRGDDGWIEQEVFACDETKGLIGRKAKLRSGLIITAVKVVCRSAGGQYSIVADDLDASFYVNHPGCRANTDYDIIAYRGPKL